MTHFLLFTTNLGLNWQNCHQYPPLCCSTIHNMQCNWPLPWRLIVIRTPSSSHIACLLFINKKRCQPNKNTLDVHYGRLLVYCNLWKNIFCIYFLVLFPHKLRSAQRYEARKGEMKTQCCFPVSPERWLKGLVHLMRLQQCDSQTLTGDFSSRQVLVEPVQPSKHFSQFPLKTGCTQVLSVWGLAVAYIFCT